MSMLRWGVLGAARIARSRVIPSIQQSERNRVVAITSRTRQHAEDAARAVNIEHVFDDYQALLQSDEIDAVYVPLPNSEHHRWVIAAANAGKHVLCEKPLALNAAQAEEMVEAARRNNVLLAEAFMYRHHPLIRTLLDLLRDNAIGELRLVRSTFSYNLKRPGDIRSDPNLGGGALLDIGCYCVSLTRLVAGAEPVAVAAVAKEGATGVDESFAGALRFPSGVAATFEVSMQAASNTCYELIGTDGKIVVRQGFRTYPGEETEIQVHVNDEISRLFVEPADHFQIMFDDFAKSALDGRPLRWDPEDAVANMRVLDQLRAAATV
jgi:predicted dehydrogenase